ncbi:YolD-like family protein [Staphylococcus pseudoxylosus]|uniref:YolD-like family protein n=1 Tax=Staphylococcus pseudoxylosus TaxID=2282419 RepID=UPI000D1D1C3C|nr:YolD-like family protein [Staphylococcus pseudoxylosus]PTI44559.1 YolD-like family protein [Staphylococcus xylosus]MDW8798315.1 YolD-like family protein [Staphylococcus pseudoxylosus]MEB6037793.1 YolD-like family protein [Staphylococcus pseudoxylosus]MEB7765060.1 YolD-like family protein [Staphylococcus pseudoxylosus]MEB8087950.1 YolD-like family protein [Staphylococcus pseudoxylosus]
MIPKKFKNETDYRNIPREYLNPNIPKGRGMVKWQPFATLPEQFETIQQYLIDQNKIDRPTLSDDQLSDLNLQLHQALHTEQHIIIEYYQSGWLEHITLKIKNIDMVHMYLEGYSLNNSEIIKLSLFDITRINPYNP